MPHNLILLILCYLLPKLTLFKFSCNKYIFKMHRVFLPPIQKVTFSIQNQRLIRFVLHVILNEVEVWFSAVEHLYGVVAGVKMLQYLCHNHTLSTAVFFTHCPEISRLYGLIIIIVHSFFHPTAGHKLFRDNFYVTPASFFKFFPTGFYQPHPDLAREYNYIVNPSCSWTLHTWACTNNNIQ